MERQKRQLSQEALAKVLGISSRSINRWEQGQAVPQGYARLQLCRYFHLSPEELFAEFEEQAPSTQVWSVPFSRNPFFTGREEILQSIHAQFHQEHSIALTQPLAISGLGGIGKTQIALEYAYRYRKDYQFVFWTSAASYETLHSALGEVADLLQLRERNEQDQKKIIQAIRQWFSTHGEWLWILDNADDVSMLSDLLPTEYSGHLLLTSRAQAWGSLAQKIEIETMGFAEGTEFLLRRAKQLLPNTPLDTVNEKVLAAAEAIVLTVDFLPLALDQAGAYIEEVGCNLSDYRDFYDIHHKELLQRRGHLPANHPEPVATTWSLSFQKIKNSNSLAASLLELCAFLDPDAIPEDLISEGWACFGLLPGPSAKATFLLNDAIEELRKFSLIQRYPATRTLRIHRLVQAVLKDTMPAELQRQWAERVVRAVNTVFPATVEMATWPRCRHYLAQAQFCSTLLQTYRLAFEEAASLLSRTASYLQVYALYEQAEPLLQDALRIRKHLLPPDHPDIATSLRNLAYLFKEQRDYQQAEVLFLDALHMQEKTLGPDHPEITRTLQGLADIYREQERNREAEPLYQRALRIWESSENALSQIGASLYHGLALLYYRQGKYTEAEVFCQRTIHMLDQALGSDHIDIARPLNSLAIIYHKQGKYSEAELLHQRVLSLVEYSLGLNHPHAALQLHNLAECAFHLKNYCKAEGLYQQALHIWASVYGLDHLRVAYPLGGLANVYRQQGLYAKAEPLYLQALHLRELHQSSLHPETAELLLDIAAFREAQGNNQEALSLYQRVLSIQKQSLPPEHPEIQITLQHYEECINSSIEIP